MPSTKTVFLAGIIQGSLPDTIHGQEYRTEIANLVRENLPDAEIYDPFENHPNSLTYDFNKSREVFFSLMAEAGKADVLISFLPEASMGTAIEMWNAYHNGALVIAVTPLEKNWVNIALPDVVLPDLAALKEFIASGALATKMTEKRG